MLQGNPNLVGSPWRLTLLGVAMLGLVTSGTVAGWSLITLKRLERQQWEALNTLSYCEMIGSMAIQARGFQRDGLLSGRPEFRRDYDQVAGPLRSHAGMLEGSVTSAADREIAERIAREAGDLVDELDAGWRAAAEEPGSDRGVSAARDAAISGKANVMLERLITDLELLTTPRQELMVAAHAAHGSESRLLTTSLVALPACAVTVLGIGIATVVGERRRRRVAERDLTESELVRQRREHLVQQSPLAVIVWSLGFRVTEWNPAAERIFGWTESEAIGMSGSNIVPSDAFGSVEEVWKELLQNRGGWRNRNANLTKNHGPITCEWYNQPLHDAGGKVVGVISLCQDVTAEEKARAGLQAALDRYERVVSGTSDGFWEYDFATRKMNASARLLEIFELKETPEDWNGWWKTACHPDDHGVVRRVNQEHAAGLIPMIDVEYRVKLSDGRYRWVRTRCRIIRGADGKPVTMAGSTRDVDARRQTEVKALRDAEFIGQVLDTSPAGVRVTDVQGRTTYLNRRAGELFELPQGKIDDPGSVDRQWHVTDFDGRHIALPDRVHAQVIATGLPIYGVEYIIRAAGGPPRMLSVNAAPLHGPDGQIEGVVYSFTDVTDREHARQKQDLLTAELQHARRIEALGNLASGVAHDFNNVLTAIYACVDSARAQLERPDAVARYLDLIEQAASGASDITQSMLAYARKGTIERRTINLRSILTESVRLLRKLLPESIGVDLPESEKPVWVYADATQLQQLLLNLAINARDAMPSGGVLTIDLECDCGSEPGGAVLTVRDTGIGITPADRERIFEPFFTTKPRGKGTGLGLAVVQGIVTGHGGTIEVQTGPGEGTSFRIHLPCCSPPDPDEPVPLPAVGAGAREGTAIIAEDDAFVRSLIGTALRSMGYWVIEVGDGRSAVDEFSHRRGAVKLVVMDLGLPVMGGANAISEIRRQDGTVPIIAISGNATRPDEDLTRCGVQVLAKPFRIAELRRAVQGLSAVQSNGATS
ncbi:MAG: PAS domain-containing hybrid sensor histidine kinase/response regulator [Phycisphaerales bacterium]